MRFNIPRLCFQDIILKYEYAETEAVGDDDDECRGATQHRAKEQISTLSAPECCVILWNWSWEGATTGLPHQQPQQQHMSWQWAPSFYSYARGWQSEAFVALGDIRGRPKQLSDFKHIPIKEEGYELSVEPF